MKEQYIEVRLVEAESAMKVDGKAWPISAPVPTGYVNESGYLVTHPNGWLSFRNKHQFESAHIRVTPNKELRTNAPSVSQEMVDQFITETWTKTEGDRTTVVRARLRNGFEIVESSSCVSAENYDENMGEQICMEKIKDKVWMLLGFLLQTAVSLSNWEAKCVLAKDSGGNCGTEAPETGDHTPTEHLTFGQAIDAAKRGEKIQREGWNGKGQYVELADCISYRAPGGSVVNAEHDAIGSSALAFVGTSGVQLGWLASQADMLANDWRVVQ